MRLPTLMAGVLPLVVGCALGPTYRAPKSDVPAQWNVPLSGGERQRQADISQWWRSFGDTELDALVQQAVQSNFTVRIAESRVREARAERTVVAGGSWPSVGSSIGYSRNRYGRNGFPPLPPGTPLVYNLYSAGFDASWELDVFGGTRRAVEAASDEIGAAEFGERDVLISLLAEVGRNYIEVRGYQERLTIARRDIAIQSDILELTRSRFRSGLSGALDVEQARALLTSTKAQVPPLQTALDEAVRHLGVLLGEPPGALMKELSVTKPIPLTPPVVPVGLPADLLERRPDVRRAERELAAATARIGVAKADLFPEFSLTGFAGVDSTSGSNWLDYASRFWSVGPTLRWELFEAGRIRANVRVQTARQAEALDSYQQVVLVALEEAENALVAYAKEQTHRELLAQTVDADQQALELSTQLYRAGLVDFLRVLDSERSLYAAQDALSRSDQSVSLDLVQLYKALGGGWGA